MVMVRRGLVWYHVKWKIICVLLLLGVSSTVLRASILGVKQHPLVIFPYLSPVFMGNEGGVIFRRKLVAEKIKFGALDSAIGPSAISLPQVK